MRTQESNTHAVVVPGQSNYGEYTLPTSLAGLGDPPLYLAVAMWGWQLGRPFCRDELAQAFRITVKRAGDVMSYIRRAAPDKIQTCQRYERVVKGVRCRYMQIMAEPEMTVQKAVRGKPSVEAKDDVAQEEGPLSDARLQALRRWFLNRPNPG